MRSRPKNTHTQARPITRADAHIKHEELRIQIRKVTEENRTSQKQENKGSIFLF